LRLGREVKGLRAHKLNMNFRGKNLGLSIYKAQAPPPHLRTKFSKSGRRRGSGVRISPFAENEEGGGLAARVYGSMGTGQVPNSEECIMALYVEGNV